MRSGSRGGIMRTSPRTTRRQGVVLAEAVIVIFVFLILVFGMMDFGIAVSRHNVLAQAARQGVRQAIVHGQLAPTGWNGGAMGMGTINEKATANDAIANVVRPMLGGSDPAATTVHVEWLDGSNQVGKRVRVTLTTS